MRYLKLSTNKGELIQESGVVDTKSPVVHSKMCKAKNIGKSNETTPDEQAIMELNSLVKQKYDEGYSESEVIAESIEILLPMLAKDYKEHSHKIDWTTAFIQPKLDGMRCLAEIKDGVVRLISRDGKKIENMAHITHELSKIKHNVVLDGELYCHGLSFQENMKLIKKYRNGETEKIVYNVYDIVSDESYLERELWISLYLAKQMNMEFVKTIQIFNEKELKSYHAQFLSQGYEGSIIRWGNAPYKIDGRSENLLKYKDFKDLAIKIKDIEPADQRPEWGVPVFEWKGAKNDELRAGVKMSHEDRKDLLANKSNYIGKTAELRFFEYSDEGVPRFPVMVGIRLDR